MALHTITVSNPSVDNWFDFVNKPSTQAVVDINIFNRGAEGSQIALGIADENRTIIDTPTGVSASKEGIHNGDTVYSYRITAIDINGETLPSFLVQVEEAENELNEDHYVSITWNAVSGAEGYRIYGRVDGSEQLLAQVDANTTSYDDQDLDLIGTPLPYFNTTGIRALLWEGHIDVDMMLEVVNRKIFVEEGAKMIAYTTAPYVDFIAFSADA